MGKTSSSKWWLPQEIKREGIIRGQKNKVELCNASVINLPEQIETEDWYAVSLQDMIGYRNTRQLIIISTDTDIEI